MTQRVESEGSRKSYNHPCLVAQALDVLGDRWTLLILRDVMAGLHRYSDILENCHGMSPNVLADRLRRLEADGLIHREYQRGLPPRVDYTLTEKGEAVRPILLALMDWGRNYARPITSESVGAELTTDFVVRMLPTFSFKPERASDLTARMVIEISDCSDCNSWTFDIHDGHIHPRRNAGSDGDIRLRTDTEGFFRFIRGEAPVEQCGELEGDATVATTIQSCFITD